MTPWRTTLTASLIGTDRASPSAPAPEGDLGDTLAALPPGEDPAVALLRRAAVLGAWRNCGADPRRRGVGLPVPAATADDERTCSPRATASVLRLGEVAHDGTLQTDRRGGLLLREWLDVLAERGCVAPASLLPLLLDMAAREEDLRPAVTAVLGARGTWLVGRSERWRGMGRAPDDLDLAHLWETGSQDERITLLEERLPGELAAMRELIASTWDAEGHRMRVRVLETIAPHAEVVDLPLLEAAHGDRRKTVRKAAAAALMRIATSSLVARMRERLQDALRRERRMLRARIEVTLPEACDKAMETDGIRATLPAGYKIGERAWWLQQMVAAVPPSEWVPELGSTADEVLKFAERGEYGDLLVGAWTLAAKRHRDAEWTRALYERYGDLDQDRQFGPDPDWHPDSLRTRLPEDVRATVARRRFASSTRADRRLKLVNEIPLPWDGQTSRDGLRAVADMLRGHSEHWSLNQRAELVVLRIAPVLIRPAITAFEKLRAEVRVGNREQVLDRIIETLLLRERLRKELPS